MQTGEGNEMESGNFWSRDLLHSKSFRKGITVVVLVPALALLLFSASAIFGPVATGIYFVLMLVGFKLYDVYEDKKRDASLRDWDNTMLKDGWKQVASNRWEMTYWDFLQERYVTSTFFTDEAIPKRFKSPRPKVRRHPSYIIQKKRIRRK